MGEGRRQNWLAQIVGAITAGRRKGDGLIRMGFAGLVVAGVFSLLDKQLTADRELRRDERQALVATLKETAEAMKRLGESVAKADDVHELRRSVDDRCGEGGRR